jgi:hypothetical protein
MLHLLKQVLYEAVSIRQGSCHMAEFALNNREATETTSVQPVREKSVVFFFTESLEKMSTSQTEFCKKILAHA